MIINLMRAESYYYKIKEQENALSQLRLETLKFDGSGKDLLLEIFSKNEERLIVVDFWGTWCTPCIKDFVDSDQTKKNFPEIAFVYFCINSTERNWKNVLVKHIKLLYIPPPS